MRRALRSLLIGLLLLGVAVFLTGWWVVRRALPQLDGSASLPELKQPVTVGRDAYGVPHIRAASLEDLLTAQGYVLAQDRLWQMDLLRRAAAGELSEVFGPRTLELDRENRTLGLRAAAEGEADRLDLGTLLMLEAYARGVNRYIEDRRNRLPWEFVALRYKPRPWRAADSLLIGAYMHKMLSNSWESELNRAKVTERVGPERARDLYVVASPLDAFTFVLGRRPPLISAAVPKKRSARRQASPADPRWQARSSAAADSLGMTPALVLPGTPHRKPLVIPSPPRRARELNVANSPAAQEETLRQFDEETRAALGSNNWVVSGAHTASAKPLLANDTHLPLDLPCIWYMTHLAAPGWNVKGLTLPGVPLVIIGHNERIAWGYTNNGADVQDLYIETFNPANPREYKVNGRWVTAEVRKELIRIKGRPDETLEVVLTRHGPIVRHEGARAYALRWTAAEPGGLAASFSSVGRAQNWREFRDAMRRVPGPAQNAVYADVDGNIGFIVAARIPIRKNGNGAVPVPGDTDDYEWTGYIPFDELPQMLNPPSGMIATANARVAGPRYKRFLTERWVAPYRAWRIGELLLEKEKLRPQDCLDIQTDILSLPHHFLARELTRNPESYQPKDPRARELLGRLKKWDGVAAADSVEMAFVEYTRRALLRNLLRPFLGDDWRLYSWWRSDEFLFKVLAEQPRAWLPEEFPTYDDLLMASADQAVAQLEAESRSAEVSAWRWGRFIRLEMQHPLGWWRWLGRLLNIGPIEQPGASNTVKQTGRSFGPAMRFVADLADWDNSLMNITAGQSGQYGSAHYRDQFRAWFEGRGLASAFSDAAEERARKHLLRLLPASP